MGAPDTCVVQGLRLIAVFASPAAPVDSTLNTLRPDSHARSLFRFQTVDDTAACERLCLCVLEGVCDFEHFSESLGALVIAPARFEDFVYGCIW